MFLLRRRSPQSTLLRHARSDLLERCGGPPAHTLSRARYLEVQLVDLFQRQALRLVDHEVHEGDAEEAACEPDEEDLRLQVGVSWAPVDEIGGAVGDGPVEEPVGGCGHGEGLGSDLEREDLPRDDPSDGAPGGSEEEDVDADERDRGFLGCDVLCENLACFRILARGGRAEDCNE